MLGKSDEHTQAKMMPFVRINNITMDNILPHVDQLAQMTVDAEGNKTDYFIYWDRRNGIWTQAGQGGPLYNSATDRSIADLVAYFHGVPDAVVTDHWIKRGAVAGAQLINLHFRTLKERHHVASLDVQV